MTGAQPESPNFAFLSAHDPALLMTAARAERYVFDDPNAALVKLRQLSEIFARGVAAHLGLALEPDDGFAQVERALRDAGQLDSRLHQIMRTVRRGGNVAAHSLDGERREALHSLKLVRQLAIWFHKAVKRDPSFKAGPFVPPPDPADAGKSLEAELHDLRTKLAEREMELAKIQRVNMPELQMRVEHAVQEARASYLNEKAALDLAAETDESLRARIADLEAGFRQQGIDSAADQSERDAVASAARQAASELDLDEQDTRNLIDQQLREAGWEADSVELRYGRGARPIKGRCLAIAESPTANGPADYVLFHGLMPIGIVEAKRSRRDVAGSIEQSKRYSRGFTVEADHESPGGPWGEYKVPFLFATNGRPFLRQIAEKSGVWFHDARRETNHPRPLEAWYTPEGLKQRLGQDIAAADRFLESETTDYLPLRDYQAEAIRAVEQKIADGEREMLLAMATGTGKTITCIGLIYRLIKSKRFRRILFLVDRTSLGQQAADKLKDVRLENLQAFPDIYDVKELGDLRPDTDTKLQIATVQAMVKRLIYADDDTDAVPVDWYDCIVVDECHRGYNLDQEMTDAELEFRSEQDYISKYRRVIDHFDAVRIGLTATPALHTTEIFGPPVYSYSYRQAVIDGWLCDHEPPFRIVTRLGEDGMKWERGEEMKIYDKSTDQLHLFNTPDEVEIEVEQFNSRVITEEFNRVVCSALADEIDPSLPGKTLIFCVNDDHAQLVERLMKEALENVYGPTHDDTVKKITGKADKPLSLIRHYKNEQLPKIAVTVDLLTTGIDVPEITNIVFIRRVRSRILYDQMLGRGTRLCEDLLGPGEDKERFRVFDAVDLYSSLKSHTEMQPVVTQPNITFAQLAKELQELGDDALRSDVRDQLLAKLRRKKLSDRQTELLDAACGLNRKQLIDHVHQTEPATLGEWLADHASVLDILDSIEGRPGRVIVSEHEDELRRVERGYGRATKPEDYLESFREFITNKRDEIPALVVVTQRPRDLTRKQLRELRLLLDQEGFSEANLRTAWRETTNQDIAASIIGYIRHVALNQPLVAHRDRVAAAMQQVLSSRQWTQPQRKWLERIGKQLEQEVIVDRDALDSGQFKAQGGFDRLNKVFKGQLDEILHGIADAMWQAAA